MCNQYLIYIYLKEEKNVQVSVDITSTMLVTGIFLCLLLKSNQIDGRIFQNRATDPLIEMRDKCQKNPSVDECVQIKSQMEDLLRKCQNMATSVSACGDVRTKYCVIWPRELFCYLSPGGGNGGGGTATKTPSVNNDPDWLFIPSDPNELKQRGDYCVAHQTEQKCRNLLNALKIRYDDCSRKPATDVSCQSFKRSLCAAFPKFSPCLNGGVGVKRKIDRLRRLFQMKKRFVI